MKVARNYIDGFRRLIEATDFVSDDITVKITISLGIGITSDEDTFDQLMIRADKALYRAKNSGRNKVSL